MAKRFIERREPCNTDTQYKVNLSGYEWASQFLYHRSDCMILDAACGMGYGAYYLSGKASRVIGIDISFEAIEFCKKKYARDNLVFMQMDCTDLKFPDSTFDAIISQDTIEHISDDKKFLSELNRVLKKDGLGIIFTPFSAVDNPKPDNIYHIREYSENSFKELLEKYFSHIRLYGRKKSETLSRVEGVLNKFRRFDKSYWREMVPRRIRHFIADLILKVSGNKRLENISFSDVIYSEDTNAAETIIAVFNK